MLLCDVIYVKSSFCQSTANVHGVPRLATEANAP